jgi:hypothetical protein
MLLFRKLEKKKYNREQLENLLRKQELSKLLRVLLNLPQKITGYLLEASKLLLLKKYQNLYAYHKLIMMT